jgi:hypothetical protein
VPDREERIGRNEAVFREANERIEWLSADEPRLTIICECGEITCDERLTVPTATYERVRGEGTHFLVLPSHEIPDVEDVVEQGSGYHVVRKHEGLPADVAKQTDPRG